ncbi:ArsR/SmtB family transcription factor [Mesobacillus thioparans]|uniref:ArsR/SmtB family transcription factor n=1 Tax=Mesobacillus thioparans TaxID=370439 RepID=UPI0039EEBA72
MAIEWDNRSKTGEVVVEHFHSPVVEFISFLSSSERNFVKELNTNSVEFLSLWESRADWNFTFLFNFLLPCPYFHDIELFLQKVSTLSEAEFLYHFFGESIPAQLLEELIEEPGKLMNTDDTIWWETDEQKSSMKKLFKTLPEFREKFLSFLLDVFQSRIFNAELEVSKVAQDSIKKVQTMEMEPLALAQYIMGKTFRRTSLYQMYYFIPSYFFSANRIRIFDSKTCIIIYGVDAPLIDFKQKSAELELQLKALSDRNRILILRMLARNKEYGAKIAEYLGITTATVSHHLELLKKAGFVQEEKVGTIKYFSYNQKHTECTLADLQKFIAPQ